MHRTIAALSLGLLVAASAWAQAPQRLLSDGDVKKFIRDFKPMTNELDENGKAAEIETENIRGLDEVLNTLRTDPEAQRILRKYGWGDRQFDKFAAIFRAYFALKLEDARTGDSGDLKEALAMIESNPGLSAEQKAEAKAQMAAINKDLLDVEGSVRAKVHPADIDVVKANEAALDEVME